MKNYFISENIKVAMVTHPKVMDRRTWEIGTK